MTPLSAADALRLAEAHANAGRMALAEEVLRQLLVREPRQVEALNALGVMALNQGQYAAAIALLERAIAVNARAPVLRSHLAEAHRRAGRAEEAIEHARAALALKPDHAGARTVLSSALADQGQAMQRAGQLEQAKALLAQALNLWPQNVAGLLLAGAIEIDRKDPATARALIESALRIEPKRADGLGLFGRALYDLGELDAAVDAYRKSVALAPTFEALLGLGNALKDLGRFEEAVAAFDACRKANPDHYLAWLNLSEVKRFRDNDDAHLVAMESVLPVIETLPQEQRVYLHFALTKAYDDLKRFDEAGDHMVRGNALQRTSTRYAEAQNLGLFTRIKAAFTQDMFAAAPSGQSEAPIFVFGMPRSGTTLVEQIIASHPSVAGAGEAPFLNQAITAFGKTAGAPYPEFVSLTDASALAPIGAQYAAKLHALAPQAKRITDKAPYNFLYAGLIRLTLPRAKMIHTIRDPIDTCLSGFSKLFAEGNAHCYDLGELGRYYRAYYELMEHWRNVLPAGSVLDIRYEDLVADIEGQARRLLAFCELEWDARVLDFHTTARPVKTWSAQQVRQPVYASSVARWRNYEHRLGPLIEALGDLARQPVTPRAEPPR